MAKDKPNFLQNIGDDEEEKEVLSVLQQSKETPSEEKLVEETASEKKAVEEKPVEEKKAEEESVETKPTEEKKAEESKAEEKPTEEKKAEEKPFMGKYKTREEFEKAYHELQRTFSKLQDKVKSAGISADSEAEDELAVFRKTPVIKSTVPDPSKYYFQNNEGEEVLDLQAYMQDAFDNFSISIQRNLLGGPLAAAVFSMLGGAIKEEQFSALEQGKREEESISIWNNIQKAYPILGKDQRLQKLFQMAIYGEKRLRSIEAEKNGTEYVDMTEADYLNLAKELVSSQSSNPLPQTEDLTEKPKGDVALREKGSKFESENRQLDADIDAMMAIKRKSLF